MKAQNRFSHTIFTVLSLKRTASGMWRKSSPMRVTWATSIATSVPLPMAMLTSARASAWVSLMPSPTMATRLPWA